MPDGFSAHVTGLKEIESNLKDLEGKLAGRALRAGVREGAEVIHEEAERLAPRRTGALAAGIKVATKIGQDRGRIAEDLGIARFQLTVTDTGKSVVRARIGLIASVFYGLFHEFGTRFMAAHPFMRPALDVKANQAIEKVTNKVRQEIQRFRPK